MCLILFAHQFHPEYDLVLAANRDEFHARPTAAAARWQDHPEVLAGRDLLSGGTWLGVRADGSWSAVTNYRDGSAARSPGPSRGYLVSEYLTSAADPESYVRSVRSRQRDFAGYNLLVGDRDEVRWTSNRTPEGAPSERRLAPGLYGLSNHLLDTPWAKVERGKAALAELLADGGALQPDRLLDVLMDRTYAADHQLPTTGIPTDFERALSAAFITTPDYGTRSSTALLRRRDGTVLLAERRFDPNGRVTGEDHFQL